MADTKEIYIVDGDDLGNIADAIRTLKNEGEDSTYSVKDMYDALEPANNPLSLTVNQGKITASVTGLAKIGKSVSDTSSDCKSENIRSGKTILGVQGTYTAAEVSLNGKIVIDYNTLEAKTNGDNVSWNESTKLSQKKIAVTTSSANNITILQIKGPTDNDSVIKSSDPFNIYQTGTTPSDDIKNYLSNSAQIKIGKQTISGTITDLTKSTSITFPR